MSPSGFHSLSETVFCFSAHCGHTTTSCNKWKWLISTLPLNFVQTPPSLSNNSLEKIVLFFHSKLLFAWFSNKFIDFCVLLEVHIVKILSMVWHKNCTCYYIKSNCWQVYYLLDDQDAYFCIYFPTLIMCVKDKHFVIF